MIAKTTRRSARKGGVRPARDLARAAAAAALAKKAEDVVILDLRELSSACDYFVVATGLSEVQVKAIADHIEEMLAADGARPWHVEGRQHRRWVLIDYVDVVVHLFHKEAREYYRLESLWADAPREELADPGPAVEEQGEEQG